MAPLKKKYFLSPKPQAVTFGGQWEPPGARGGDEVARVTVALARAGPQDLVGRLRVTAAVRGLRCDVVGLGPERLLRWVPKNPKKVPPTHRNPGWVWGWPR